jgi:UDP-glucose 4-epimerase
MGEVDKNFSSSEKANKKFGFSPQTLLQEGLKKTWVWHSEASHSLV